MKRRRANYMARINRCPTPRQLEMGGTVTSDAVANAVQRERKRSERAKSWEDDFAFHVQAHRLPPITRKFQFARSLGRKWEADFAYPDRQLLIEVDGGIWRKGGGAHSHPMQILRDMSKGNDAAYLGYHVLRFTSDEVRNGSAVAFLIRVLSSRGWTRE
jgi:very-short-patch-repair endonuclease